MAQRKRAGLITRRTHDRNVVLLPVGLFFVLFRIIDILPIFFAIFIYADATFSLSYLVIKFHSQIGGQKCLLSFEANDFSTETKFVT